MNIDELYQSLPVRYPELQGQVAIVSGSSQGIGSGIAARLAREGLTSRMLRFACRVFVRCSEAHWR